MATYVMRDLHGRFDLYQKMLKIIDFSKDDHLSSFIQESIIF